MLGAGMLTLIIRAAAFTFTQNESFAVEVLTNNVMLWAEVWLEGAEVWEHLRPLQRAAGTRPADCLMVFLCVLHEYLCQCAFVQRNAHGPLFVSANPFSSLSFLAQGSFCPFVQHCSACRRSPPFLSVCYLQPFCHISPLPATFLVISEGAAYLFSERRLQASVLPC